MIQLQHSLQQAVRPSMEVLEAWADHYGAVCLHDMECSQDSWMQKAMDNNLKGIIRKALQPSRQFTVSSLPSTEQHLHLHGLMTTLICAYGPTSDVM